MMRTLFLHPPSFDGFDGGAGARYQAKREIRSFWYPTWLAQPAALVPGSRLLDAPADGLSMAEVLPLARVDTKALARADLLVLGTWTEGKIVAGVGPARSTRRWLAGLPPVARLAAAATKDRRFSDRRHGVPPV